MGRIYHCEFDGMKFEIEDSSSTALLFDALVKLRRGGKRFLWGHTHDFKLGRLRLGETLPVPPFPRISFCLSCFLPSSFFICNISYRHNLIASLHSIQPSQVEIFNCSRTHHLFCSIACASPLILWYHFMFITTILLSWQHWLMYKTGGISYVSRDASILSRFGLAHREDLWNKSLL